MASTSSAASTTTASASTSPASPARWDVLPLLDERDQIAAFQRLGCDIPRTKPVNFVCAHTNTEVRNQLCFPEPAPHGVHLDADGVPVIIVRRPMLCLACLYASAEIGSPVLEMLVLAYGAKFPPDAKGLLSIPLPRAPSRDEWTTESWSKAQQEGDKWHAAHVGLAKTLSIRAPKARFLDEKMALLLRAVRVGTVDVAKTKQTATVLKRWFWIASRARSTREQVFGPDPVSTTSLLVPGGSGGGEDVSKASASMMDHEPTDKGLSASTIKQVFAEMEK
jgi:hypothetical protein